MIEAMSSALRGRLASTPNRRARNASILTMYSIATPRWRQPSSSSSPRHPPECPERRSTALSVTSLNDSRPRGGEGELDADDPPLL